MSSESDEEKKTKQRPSSVKNNFTDDQISTVVNIGSDSEKKEIRPNDKSNGKMEKKLKKMNKEIL